MFESQFRLLRNLGLLSIVSNVGEDGGGTSDESADESKSDDTETGSESEDKKTEVEVIQESTDKKVAEDKKKMDMEISELLGVKVEEEAKEEEKEDETEEESDDDSDKSEDDQETGEEEEETEEEEEDKTDADPLLDELKSIFSETGKGEFKLEDEEKKEDVKEEKKEEKKELHQPAPIADPFLTEVKLDTIDFIKKEDFEEDTFSEKELTVLNKALNTAATKFFNQFRTAALQDVMKHYSPHVHEITRGHLTAENFWRRNPELSDFCDKNPEIKNYVSYVANRISKKNTNMSLKQVYDETEKEVKRTLGDRLKKNSDSEADPEEKKNSSKKKSFVRKPKKKKVIRSGNSNLTDAQKEIAEMIEFGKRR